MGWCSATEIMDWAIQMADLAVEEALGDAPDDETQARVEDRIRSRVACLARKLHDEDWDCETEADAFDRFPQEMLGYGNAGFAEWVRNELVYEKNPDRIAMLSEHLQKLAVQPMAGETVITVVGNLTADPELRFTQSDAAVANFTVASTPSHFDKQSGKWVDDPALFLRCNAWRQLAENVAESLTRGTRVVVSGRLRQRGFEDKSGEKRTVVELEVDEIGPSLRYATAKVNKVSRGDGGGGFGGGASTPADDPWGQAPPATGGGFADEPPF